MIEVKISNGSVLIDDQDAEILSIGRWYLIGSGQYKYAVINLNGNTKSMHRLLLNAEEGQIVDHVDGNTLNNTRENLRVCTHSQNMQNRRIQKNNKSGHRGVHFLNRRKTWCAEIYANNKRISIGTFRDKKDAISAYREYANILHGEFKRF